MNGAGDDEIHTPGDAGDTFTFPIEWGMVDQFARAIGDTDADYLARGFAPLTFTMAADHFDPGLRSQLGERGADLGLAPRGSRQGFHASQRFTYHRHIRVGDVLTARRTTARTWTKPRRSGGSLYFVETPIEFSDAEGQPCITVHWTVCFLMDDAS